VWFDAHADFNDPSTTLSGYLDGMGLAVLTGGAWQGMLAEVPSAQPVPESRVVLAGARNYDAPEEARLRTSQVVQVPAERLRSPEVLVKSIEARETEVSGLYLHVDLDVLDADVARVNVHSAPDGINGDQLDDLVAALTAKFPVRAVSLTAYDPACDVDVHVPPIALQLLRTIARTLD
jgi:arginase